LPRIIRIIKSRMMRWAGYVAHILGEKRKAYRILMGKLEGKGPLGRPTHRWENNTKMDLTEIGWGGMDWIDLAQDRDQYSTHFHMGFQHNGAPPHYSCEV
jgi:hypothetical protein